MRQMRATTRPDRAVDLGPPDGRGERLEAEPGDPAPGLDGGCGEALEVVGLAGARRARTGRGSRPGPATRAWRGRAGWAAGWPTRPPARRRGSCPTGSRPPGGASPSWPRRARRPPRRAGPGGPRRDPSAGPARWRSTSGAARRMYGQAEPVEDRRQLGRQGRRLGRVHRPKPAQAPVPGWTLNASSSTVSAGAGLARGEMVEDRGEVGLGEAPRDAAASASAASTRPRPTSAASSTARAILERTRTAARRRRLDEPGLGPGTEGEEGRLVGIDRSRPGAPAAPPGRVVEDSGRRRSAGWPGVERAWRAISASPASVRATIDDLVAADAHPDLGPDERAGHRVADRAQADRLVVRDGPGLAEGRGVRLGGQDVEVGTLDARAGRRGARPGLAVDPAVHLRAERDAGGGKVGEAAIRRAAGWRSVGTRSALAILTVDSRCRPCSRGRRARRR